MRRAMIMQTKHPLRNTSVGRNRGGLSLLEVIICTGLVAVMIVPLSGVIRASGKSIARAEGGETTEAEMRRGLLWLNDLVRDAEVLSVRSSSLQLRLASGNQATVQVSRGDLQLIEGSQRTTIVQDVRDASFRQSSQFFPPRRRTGVTTTIRKLDPQTQTWVTMDSTVALSTHS